MTKYPQMARKRNKNGNWREGRSHDGRGYTVLLMPEHPRANTAGYIREYILIAEKALGKPLPPKAIVHHHSSDQLVICQDQAYHNLLHQRQRAYEACGHASWRKCWICKIYDDPQNLIVPKNGTSAHHNLCRRIFEQASTTFR